LGKIPILTNIFQMDSRVEIHSTVGQPSGEIDGEMLEMKKETVEMREKQVMGKFHPEFQ